MSTFASIPEWVEKRKAMIKHEVMRCDVSPILTIVKVGNDPVSDSYTKGKIADCKEVGINAKLVELDESTTTYGLQKIVLMENLHSDGVIVQLPLPKHIDLSEVISVMSLFVDVDGFKKDSYCNPCTPQGIVDYLVDACGYDLAGKNALVIGRSNLVGRPLAKMLLDRDASVAVAHSKTPAYDLRDMVAFADIVFTAIDKIQYFDWTRRMCSDGLLAIDIGLGRGEDGKLHGNLSDYTIDNIASSGGEVISGVGGVGLLTRLALLENVVKLHKMR